MADNARKRRSDAIDGTEDGEPPKEEVPTPSTSRRSRARREEVREAMSIAREFTQELPIDPVMAEDGKIYERTAIRSGLERNGEGDSPIRVPTSARIAPAARSQHHRVAGQERCHRGRVWPRRGKLSWSRRRE